MTHHPVERQVIDMNKRQRRTNEATANAVARGLNILDVRDAALARHYMEYKDVPGQLLRFRREVVRRRPGQRRLQFQRGHAVVALEHRGAVAQHGNAEAGAGGGQAGGQSVVMVLEHMHVTRNI